MDKETLSRLHLAMKKYETQKYKEADFHLTLDSIARTITENELYDLREFLDNMESNLEFIDFMTNPENRRSKYLSIIDQIKEYLIKNNIS